MMKNKREETKKTMEEINKMNAKQIIEDENFGERFYSMISINNIEIPLYYILGYLKGVISESELFEAIEKEDFFEYCAVQMHNGEEFDIMPINNSYSMVFNTTMIQSCLVHGDKGVFIGACYNGEIKVQFRTFKQMWEELYSYMQIAPLYYEEIMKH